MANGQKPVTAEFCNFGERCGDCRVASLAPVTRANLRWVIEAQQDGYPRHIVTDIAASAVHAATPSAATYQKPHVLDQMADAAEWIALDLCEQHPVDSLEQASEPVPSPATGPELTATTAPAAYGWLGRIIRKVIR